MSTAGFQTFNFFNLLAFFAEMFGKQGNAKAIKQAATGTTLKMAFRLWVANVSMQISMNQYIICAYPLVPFQFISFCPDSTCSNCLLVQRNLFQIGKDTLIVLCTSAV